jgi:hypothetical protein
VCGAALSGWACTSSEDTGPLAAAGQGGDDTGLGAAAGQGGDDTENGAGSGGGDGGSAGERECLTSLRDFCAQPAGCPEQPDDVELDFCEVNRPDFAKVVERDNDCGGKSIVEDSSFVGAVYHFDADGKLVGVETWSDVADRCPNDFGKKCSIEGPVTTLCGDLDYCSDEPLDEVCAERPELCPADIESAPVQEWCAAGDTVSRFMQDPFTILRRANKSGRIDMSFGGDGTLSGLFILNDTVSECPLGGFSNAQLAGVTGEPSGKGEDLCGAAGAGGNGGAGGSD